LRKFLGSKGEAQKGNTPTEKQVDMRRSIQKALGFEGGKGKTKNRHPSPCTRQCKTSKGDARLVAAWTLMQEKHHG